MCDECNSKKLCRSVEKPQYKLIVQCSYCDNEYLNLISFTRDEDDEHEYPELYISINGCQIYGMWDRIKIAWQVIRHGEYENNGIISKEKDLKKIKEYINNCLNYWKELEK